MYKSKVGKLFEKNKKDVNRPLSQRVHNHNWQKKEITNYARLVVCSCVSLLDYYTFPILAILPPFILRLFLMKYLTLVGLLCMVFVMFLTYSYCVYFSRLY